MIFISTILKEVWDANMLEGDQPVNIYVDLDGVLVNFDKGFEQISGGVSKEQYINNHGKKSFWELVNSKGVEWWSNLEMMPDANELWNAIKGLNVTILTSGAVKNTGLFAKKGKHEWVERHLGSVPVIVVDSSPMKQFYAKGSPYNVLIDDLPSNIAEWKAQGGSAILHTSAKSTLKQLASLGFIKNENYGYSWSNV
jgi:5' nucleotidase, deoxy (Pyrimidine), cytosolic type C protein (NT5C)